MTALIYHLEKISRSRCRERKMRESLVTSNSLKHAAGSSEAKAARTCGADNQRENICTERKLKILTGDSVN